MTIPINIQNTVINFPASGDSPNWSPAVIQFALAVEAALASFVGPFDIPPQVFVMTSNANNNVNLPNLAFPTSTVRGAIISYSVFRNTTGSGAMTISETGEIYVNYNPTSGVGQKWEINRDYIGDAKVTFNVTDVGQVQFSSALITGISHTGEITYQAKSILQS